MTSGDPSGNRPASIGFVDRKQEHVAVAGVESGRVFGHVDK
jgi:hypothetical protein